MLLLALKAVAVGYLPGALLFRWPGASRQARAALAAEERVFWAVLLSIAWSVLVTIGLAGVGAYTFERLLLVNGGLSAVVVLLGRTRWRLGPRAAKPRWPALIPAGLVVAGVWLLFPPNEYVMGGKDPGTYLNEGVQIAQRGVLRYTDPMVADLPPRFRDMFFQERQDSDAYFGTRFMGFFILDPDAGVVTGQFPHGYPASVAIGYGVNGLSGARQVVGFWTLLGLVAVYLVGVRVFGHLAAAAGAGLLLINVVTLWWGRSPNAEVATQALLFGSLLAFSHAVEGQRRFFGVVAGALAGLPLFFRYDAILTIGAAVGAAALVVANRQRAGWPFGVSLAASAAIGWWYVTGPMHAYSASYVAITGRMSELGLGGVALAIAARLLLARERWATLARRWIPPAFSIVLVSLAVYAYFFRQQAGLLAEHDAMALRSFAWYVSAGGLLAGVVGLVVACQRHFWRAPIVFVTIAIHAVFFFYKIRIVPEHFWASRRFVTVLVPATALLAAGLATELVPSRWFGQSRWTPMLRVAIVLALLAPLAQAFWQTSAPVRDHLEYAGLIPNVERLAAQIGDNDLLLVESRQSGRDLHVLAVPLAYIYDRNVIVVAGIDPPKALFAEFVGWAEERYDRVLFMGSSQTDMLSRELGATPLASERFSVPEYDSPRNAFPRSVLVKEFAFGLAELETQVSPVTGPIDLSIGELDDLFVRGAYTAETHQETGQVFRWTGPTADILLAGFAQDATELILSMGHGGRPEAAPRAEVTVLLDGRVLGQVVPVNEVQSYRFEIPAALAEQVSRQGSPGRLTLQTSTWTPLTYLGIDDPRNLGIMLTRVQIH